MKKSVVTGSADNCCPCYKSPTRFGPFEKRTTLIKSQPSTEVQIITHSKLARGHLRAVKKEPWWGSWIGPSETVVTGTDCDFNHRVANAVRARNGYLIVIGNLCRRFVVKSMPSCSYYAGQDLQGAGPGAIWASGRCGFRNSGFGGFWNADAYAGTNDIVYVEAQIDTNFDGIRNTVLFLDLQHCKIISASTPL